MADPVKFKEKFVDPATGETVTRLEIKPELTGQIEKLINENVGRTQHFLGAAQSLIVSLKRMMEINEQAIGTEKNIGQEVVKIREKMGIDSSWIYNIGIKMMEKREPPPETKVI